jgi:replication-associated recombination protein RarA
MDIRQLFVLEQKKEEKILLLDKWDQKFNEQISAFKKSIFDEFDTFFKNNNFPFTLTEETKLKHVMTYKAHTIILENTTNSYNNLQFQLSLQFAFDIKENIIKINYIPQHSPSWQNEISYTENASALEKVIVSDLNKINKEIFLIEYQLNNLDTLSWRFNYPKPYYTSISNLLKYLLLENN